ncbi:MAG: GH116 family glycosyl-hydrolase, partial [Opitutaceae bacterium]
MKTPPKEKTETHLQNRRDFIKASAGVATAIGAFGAISAYAQAGNPRESAIGQPSDKVAPERVFNGVYQGSQLSQVAFPLGGIGAGMVCIEGTGRLSHLSLRHRPEIFNEPKDVFSALWIKQTGTARVLEGPVPDWKKFGLKGSEFAGSGNGGTGTTYGLPRFAKAVFASRFPFADITLNHPGLPVDVAIRAWSPFVPGDSYHSSLPVAALEFTFVNTGSERIDCVYSFNAKNFMSVGDDKLSSVETLPNGFVFCQKPLPDKPQAEGYFSAVALDPNTKSNGRWFRGGWFDALTMIWEDIASGFCDNRSVPTEGDPSPGASLMVPFSLVPGEKKTVPVLFSWYVPSSNLSVDAPPASACAKDEKCSCNPFYKPWYSVAFPDFPALRSLWQREYAELREKTQRFTDCFYDTNLMPEVVEAVAANLSILKSPTILRQADGRLWAWEGCFDSGGCCSGSCTHVWNYAQAIAHLFPDLERTYRQTEFGENQDGNGHQRFRAALPIQPGKHGFHAAADGQ